MWQATDFSVWQGRVDAEDGDAGLRWHQVIREPESDQPGTCLLGFASDLGVRLNQGRVGAAEGPEMLRKSLGSLPAHPDHPLFDAGTVSCSDDLAQSQNLYADEVAKHLNQQQFVIGLGGGHEIGWASFMGVRQWLDQHNPTARLGILNFDAHFDLRKPNPGGTSGTPFRQVADLCDEKGLPFDYACIGISEAANTQALFQYADDKKVRYLRDRDCIDLHASPFIRRFIGELDYLYVTVCLDVLPASVAPGVSAPSAIGISPGFLLFCLEEVRRCCLHAHCQWLMADVAELNPSYDLDNRTARTAARIVWELDRLQRGDGSQL